METEKLAQNRAPLVGYSGFQRDVLMQIAALDEPSGADVKYAMQRYYDRVDGARVYQSMDQLIESGLAEKRAVNGRKNAYYLTGQGERTARAALEWRQEALSDE